MSGVDRQLADLVPSSNMPERTRSTPTSGTECDPDVGGNININIAMPGVRNDEIYQPILGSGCHFEALLEIVRQVIHNIRRSLDMSSLSLC